MADQRQRVLAALGVAVRRHGYRSASVKHVIELAGVSRRTFYELFRSKDDAFRAAHEEALDEVTERIVESCESSQGWPSKVRAAVEAALQWAAAEPDRARLLVYEPLIAGPHKGYCHDLLVARFAPLLGSGRDGLACEGCAHLDEGLLVGFSSVVASRLAAKRADSLTELAPQVAEFLLSPVPR